LRVLKQFLKAFVTKNDPKAEESYEELKKMA